MELVIVGLGNAKPQYIGTRHNVGYDVVCDMINSDFVSDCDINASFQKKGKALVYTLNLLPSSNNLFLGLSNLLPSKSSSKQSDEATYDKAKITKLHLLLPQTFMNLSGEAVLEFVNYHKIPPNHILVITDDLDLEFGKIRIKPKGSSAGHKGVANITKLIASENFYRLKIGIGKPQNSFEVSNFVLSKFSKDEQQQLSPKLDFLKSNLLQIIIAHGLSENMIKNLYKSLEENN